MYYTSKYHSLPVVDHSIRKPAVLSDTRNDITETVNIQHDNATMHMELPDNRQTDPYEYQGVQPHRGLW